MWFETRLALRYITTSPGQTGLTVCAVAAAVCLIIFINCLLNGVQARFIRDLIGAIPHITVKVPDPDPEPLPSQPGRLISTRVEKQFQKRQDLRNPEAVMAQLRTFPHVKAVVASVAGSGFVIRGARQFGVQIRGAEPVLQEQIVGLSEDIVAGRWLTLGIEEMVIGFRLAEDIGVGLGDRVTLLSSESIDATFTVAGIFDTGQNAVDGGQVFVTLPAAQRLFATGREASSISLKLDDPWQANRVAAMITSSLGYRTESWMVEQAQFVNAFAAQNGSRLMISAFSLLASAFGIASVLIVSVFQRSRQIGILKSMGATEGQILRVFTLQGLFISIIGASLGAVASYFLLDFLAGFKQVARFGKGDQLFPVEYSVEVFAAAILAAILATVLAALLPAIRASRLNPVEVISEG